LIRSCKSIAFPVPALRGEFTITKNIVEKVHKAAEEWETVIRVLRDDPALLGVDLPEGTVIDGLIVFPSAPFYTDARWRTDVFGTFPYLLSVGECPRCSGCPATSIGQATTLRPSHLTAPDIAKISLGVTSTNAR
jgi:hypothetical protein